VLKVNLTRHRIPLEFAEKGGYSSYTRSAYSDQVVATYTAGCW
jgi:hypothetical protein